MKWLPILWFVCIPAFAQTNKFKPYVAPVAAVTAPGRTNEITILRIDRSLPPYQVCAVSGAGPGQILLSGLSPTLKTDFETVARLESATTKEAADLKAAWKQLKAEQANAPSSAHVGTVWADRIRILNVRQNQLQERDNDLKEQVDALVEARERLKDSRAVTAYDTGQKYGSYPIWRVIP